MRITEIIKSRLKKKAQETPCRFKISAFGFNYKGELVAKATNQSRFIRHGGGLHAEAKIMQSAKRKGIKTIIICRIGRQGNLLPIEPCDNCKKLAEKLNIKIISVTE